MPQAIRTVTDTMFKLKFEELPLFWQFKDGTCFRTARIDGEFEVAVDHEDDWTITDIWMEVDNGRNGPHAAGCTLNLDADKDERFYLLVLDAITDKYKAQIEEQIESVRVESSMRAPRAMRQMFERMVA